MRDEARRLEAMAVGLRDEQLRALPAFPAGAPCMLAQTTAISAYPTTAAAFYACTPVSVVGSEVEGGAGTIASRPGTFLALNLGTAIPPQGTQVVVTYVGRWVFRYDS
jgi:hypothetical protein